MSHSDQKKLETASQQPTSTELSNAELDRVTGGDAAATTQTTQTTTTTTSGLHFTKVVDKASPYLF